MKNLESKRIVVIGAIIAIFLIVTGVILIKSRQTVTETTATKEVASRGEEESVVPTVDSSVQVELQPLNLKREVELRVSGIPPLTKLIDYELSYDTEGQGLQGVIGQVRLNPTEDKISKRIMLGTSSSGVNVYHKVVGDISVTLKFTGSYGEKLFEKNFKFN